MSHTTRRNFLKTAAASTAFATFAIAGTKSSGKVIGANDTIRIGVAGIKGRGGAHIDSFAGLERVDVTYLIDPDTRLFGSRARHVESRGGNKPTTVQDIRRALDDKNLDAVSIATPNHWHSLIGIWACQAEKDVYVEKPLSHNIHEGRILAEAASKYGRIVQHGTQGRGSGGHARRAREIAEGKHGKLLVSRGTCFKRRDSIGVQEPTSPPAELDFNLWLGPAPQQDHHGNLVHYNWHWFWDFGNGDIGNQGVHQMDVARWMIPNATWPKSVISVGGRFGYEDQGQTPNTQIVIFDYGDAQLLFEVRGLPTAGGVGNSQHFDNNTSVEPQEVKPLAENVKNPTADRGPGDVFSNFIHCMRTRNEADLDAHVLEGHISSGLGHLANISYRLGENVPFNNKTKAFGDNKVAYEALEKMGDHLKDNQLSLDQTTYRVGRLLQFDAATEKFVNDEDANLLLSRSYRAPFVVPETLS